jgi:pimeloyl-ACP methyl ester carboxylesterase
MTRTEAKMDGGHAVVRRGGDEAGALVRLGFEELGGFTQSIGTMEREIAARTFRAVPAGRPIQLIHDAISHRVSGALAGAASTAGRGAQTIVERRPRPRRPLSASLPGGIGLAVLNGLVGDRLERDGSPLHQPMAVRVGGMPVAPQRAALAQAFPAATPRLVVFVHGLMGEEHGWLLGVRGGREDYGTRLAREHGLTPVYVRYNTGRHISENGRSLADLLERVVAEWPVRVDEVALVGHSMGGLVSRSAAHIAKLDGYAWVERVRKVVSLGSPHMGAPLEQAVHYAAFGLSRLPETRMLGTFLRRRSSGIRDLRQGSLVDEDWRDRDPEVLRAIACQEVPLLEGATHCFVSATVTRSARHPLGRMIGDTLVLVPSASGESRTRKLGFEAEFGLQVGGTHHIALLNHPAVYEKLHAWLA